MIFPRQRLTVALARCNPVYSRPRTCPCQGVLGEDGAWIETTARIRDELQDGDHVWIDVGDGNATLTLPLTLSLTLATLTRPSP